MLLLCVQPYSWLFLARVLHHQSGMSAPVRTEEAWQWSTLVADIIGPSPQKLEKMHFGVAT